MTQSEWHICNDPRAMLNWLQSTGRLSERKARLFGCACVRAIWHLLNDDRSTKAVRVAEEFADGLVDDIARAQACQAAYETATTIAGQALGQLTEDPNSIPTYFGHWRDLRSANAATLSVQPDAFRAAQTASDQSARAACLATNDDLRDSERVKLLIDEQRTQQVKLLRCVIGNPFRTTSIEPSLLTSEILTLARTAYDTRDFSRLPDLADALEAAGCQDAEVLGHLRGPGPHVRGCWVVDLVLGKK